MGIDFYDRMWEEEQKEKERFGQRKNEIENELSSQRRKIERLEKENEQLKTEIANYEETVDRLYEDQKDIAGELELWQRENAEFKQKINKMKCCGNCKNRMHEFVYDDLIECKFGLNESYQKDCGNWELAE